MWGSNHHEGLTFYRHCGIGCRLVQTHAGRRLRRKVSWIVQFFPHILTPSVHTLDLGCVTLSLSSCGSPVALPGVMAPSARPGHERLGALLKP